MILQKQLNKHAFDFYSFQCCVLSKIQYQLPTICMLRQIMLSNCPYVSFDMAIYTTRLEIVLLFMFVLVALTSNQFTSLNVQVFFRFSIYFFNVMKTMTESLKILMLFYGLFGNLSFFSGV